MKVVNRSGGGRDGIALVIVLGFLTVLTIMAVAFAVAMRTERLAANVSLHGIRARHLTHAALAQATSTLDASLRNNQLVYPTVSGVASTGSDSLNPPLLDSSATSASGRYVPAAMLPGASAAGQWIDVLEGSVLVGRTAYVAVDCAGLLDISRIGGSARDVGASPAEIQLNTTLVPTINNVAQFLASRGNTWKRFESIPDLMAAPYLNAASGSSCLNVFSAFPTGRLDTATFEAAPQVFIGGALGPADSTRIRDAFVAMGTVPDAADAALAVIDYADADHRPGNLASFCMEDVPMINEIIVTNVLEDTGGTYVNKYKVLVEVWYPFDGADRTATFTVGARATYGGVSAGLTPSPLNTTAVLSETSWSLDTFAVGALPAGAAWQTSPGTTNLASLVNATVTLSEVWIEAGGIRLDEVRNLVVPIGTGFAPGPLPISLVQSRSADDPRLNWDGADAAQWRNLAPAAPTPGAVNGSLSTAAPGDGSTVMYVANRDIQVPGELGFLPYSKTKHWQTIDLLATNVPVLTYFTTSTGGTVQGLVNPNSPAADALASVFLDQPIESYPGAPGGRKVNLNEARALGQALSAAGPFANLGDIGAIGPAAVDGAVAGLDPLQRESIIRNAASLFSCRQNLFLVFVAGQSIMDGDADGTAGTNEVMAESRAVALWWRDPYPTVPSGGGAKRNNNLVRFFRWLDD